MEIGLILRFIGDWKISTKGGISRMDSESVRVFGKCFHSFPMDLSGVRFSEYSISRGLASYEIFHQGMVELH